MFNIGAVGSAESIHHLLGVGRIVRAAEQVVANSLEVAIVGEVYDTVEALNFHEQVNCLRLFMVLHEVRNDNVHEEHKVREITLSVLLHTLVINLTNFTSKRSQVLMSPINEISAGSLKAVLECFIRAFF
jgi:hypothetical protein